jgi:hypothetical protein
VIRTPDPVVNSHLLCQLSYRGMSNDSSKINSFLFGVKRMEGEDNIELTKILASVLGARSDAGD